jgi:hypothetical protein
MGLFQTIANLMGLERIDSTFQNHAADRHAVFIKQVLCIRRLEIWLRRGGCAFGLEVSRKKVLVRTGRTTSDQRVDL